MKYSILLVVAGLVIGSRSLSGANASQKGKRKAMSLVKLSLWPVGAGLILAGAETALAGKIGNLELGDFSTEMMTSPKGWFFLGLLVVIPLVMVFAFGRKSGRIMESDRRMADAAGGQRCRFCNELIRQEAKVCSYCKKKQSGMEAKVVERIRAQNQVGSMLSYDKKLHETARSFFRNREYQKAVQTYSMLIRSRPDSTLFYERAASFAKLGDKKKMQKDLIAATNLGHEKAKDTLIRMRNQAVG